MALRKDDPVYYKDKISKLVQQAKSEGLDVSVYQVSEGVRLSFRADNGETASVLLKNK